MQPKSLSLSGKTQDKTSSSEFSSKQPLAENNTDLKKFLAFAIDKMVETAKETEKCTDISQKVEDKLTKKYGFGGEAIARLYNPVFWTLTSERTLILCDHDQKLGMVWVLSKENEEKILSRKKEIIEGIIEKYGEYLLSNMKVHKVDLSIGSKE